MLHTHTAHKSLWKPPKKTPTNHHEQASKQTTEQSYNQNDAYNKNHRNDINVNIFDNYWNSMRIDCDFFRVICCYACLLACSLIYLCVPFYFYCPLQNILVSSLFSNAIDFIPPITNSSWAIFSIYKFHGFFNLFKLNWRSILSNIWNFFGKKKGTCTIIIHYNN